MKSNKVHLFLLLVLLYTACKIDKTPVQSEEYIDSKIIGVWYKSILGDVKGKPDHSVSGFQITNDGYMYDLGIEVSTGNLAKYSDTNYSSQILGTKNGEMEIFVPRSGMALDHTYFQKYKITNSDLTFYSNGGDTTIYKRSKIGENVCQPAISRFFTTFDSDTFRNATVWDSPSAYFGYINFTTDSMVYEIYARSYNNQAIRIRIINFNGNGTYVLGTGNDGMGYFEEIGGCMIGVSFTEQPNSGYITIDEYDLQNNICSGTFEFYVFDHQMEFTNGQFRIPTYR